MNFCIIFEIYYLTPFNNHNLRVVNFTPSSKLRLPAMLVLLVEAYGCWVISEGKVIIQRFAEIFQKVDMLKLGGASARTRTHKRARASIVKIC